MYNESFPILLSKLHILFQHAFLRTPIRLSSQIAPIKAIVTGQKTVGKSKFQ